MSRARPITIDGIKHWFDVHRNGQKATADQLELLASAEDIDLDDLLDEGLSQGDVLERLRKALGQGGIPTEVEFRKKRDAAARRVLPACRNCEAEGNSTRHHFINKWIMRELENYAAYAARSLCTIPLCTTCHRDLHQFNGNDKSIVPLLDADERKFAHKLISLLLEERPKIFWLLAGGDPQVYESRLIRDFIAGEFSGNPQLPARVPLVLQS